MSRSGLEDQAKRIVTAMVTGGVPEASAANAVNGMIGTVVAVCGLNRSEDLYETYAMLREITSGQIVFCYNCNWHETEDHPHREGIKRCSNCKEYRVKL